MENAPVRIIQITDTHLFGNPLRALLGVNTDESFNVLLQLLLASKDKNADMLLLTGDISQDGSEDSYVRIADELEVLKIPVHVIPGNHDDLEVMKSTYPYKTVTDKRQLVIGNWNIILLDSHKPNSVYGVISEKEFKFLEESLHAHPKHHALIVFHHHPIPINSVWLDKIGIKNADEFWEFVGRYPQVNTVLYGHIHQENEAVKNGIRCLATPSTCIQFKRDSATFKLDKLPPAYRWLELYDNGEIKTGIQRTPEYVGYFDKDATGY